MVKRRRKVLSVALEHLATATEGQTPKLIGIVGREVFGNKELNILKEVETLDYVVESLSPLVESRCFQHSRAAVSFGIYPDTDIPLMHPHEQGKILKS